MKRTLFWVLAALFAGVLIGAFFQGGDKNRTPQVPAEKAPGDATDQVIESFKLEGFGEEGVSTWRLKGDTAHVAEKGNVFIEKNVELIVGGQTVINGDKVLWVGAESKFVTSQPVVVTHEEVRLTGRGALGDMNRKFIQINQNIRLTVPPSTLITCKGPAKIYQTENRFSLFRDVWIVDERGTVKADRMEGIFDPKERKIITVTAYGHVRISKGEDVTFCEVATYDTRVGSVKLEGAPEINIRSAQALKQDPEAAKLPLALRGPA